MHRKHYLHGYHGAVPPMALIALLATMARSTIRSTIYYGRWPIPTTQRDFRLEAAPGLLRSP